MNIILFGSSGFIGCHVYQLLTKTNHNIRCISSKSLNFAQSEINKNTVIQMFYKTDVIINMVGIMSNNHQLMQAIHHDTPLKLAQIAKSCHVKKWINISALGANSKSHIAFVKSKGQGDKAILDLQDDGFDVHIVRPSLIFGKGGTSTNLFLLLAKMPILPLPNGGKFIIQPVHIDDVAQGIINIALHKYNKRIINFTGAEMCTLSQYLTHLRHRYYNKPNAFIITIPYKFTNAILKISRYFTNNMISPDSLELLNQGSVSDNTYYHFLLKKMPISYKNF